MIDEDGFRSNVGIILLNNQNKVFWAKRVGHKGWQFPQGGMRTGESFLDALYRELYEETGLQTDDVSVLGKTEGWLSYTLPTGLRRQNQHPLCVGQKQKWFLLRLTGSEESIRFDRSQTPEFDDWRWVDYWFPLKRVIRFKRNVYRQALEYFEPQVFQTTSPSRRSS